MSDCIFCRIVERTLPAEIVYEDEHILGFKDLYPKAPVHLLVIPKIHIVSLAELRPEHANLAGHLMTHLPIIAEQHSLQKGFRTIFNTGKIGGQEVFHLHAHILGGQTTLPPMVGH